MTQSSSSLTDAASSDDSNSVQLTKGPSGEPPAGRGSAGLLGFFRRDLGVDRLSGVYVIIVMIIGFSLWQPDTFGTINNGKVILAGAAITGIIAMGAVIALIAGVFDLSIAANMSLAISVVGKLQASGHLNAALAVVLTLILGGLVGCVNAVIVTRFGIEPVIGTLAMSSVLAAVAYWVSSGNTILVGISKNFTKIGSLKPLGMPISVFFLAAVALLLWYILEHTPTGRYLYAAGANPQAARLSGVNVVRLQWSALITSGVLAALAGVVFAMQIGSAPHGAGNSYLLPAYAAAFLGSTQIRPGRFNVLGTIIAMYLLGVGVKGLQLKYPQYPWIQNLVEGLVLLIAVGIAVRAARRRALRH